MPTEIPDLWDDDIKIDVLPPVLILKAQAVALSRKTSGILSGSVRTEFSGVAEGKNSLKETHILELTATAYGYSEEILKVTHSQSRVYPAKIELPASIEWSNPRGLNLMSWNATQATATVDEFLKYLREALRSPLTRGTIDTLIARSNESRQVVKV